MEYFKTLLTLKPEAVAKQVLAKLKKQQIPFEHLENSYIVTTKPGCLPLLCVHLDTVSSKPPRLQDIEQTGTVLSLRLRAKATCLGADDRAGVWIALKLLELKLKPATSFNFAFFFDEEIGALGSTTYLTDHPTVPHSCFIGLDRNSRDTDYNAALYSNDNKDLIKLFAAQGFVSSFGTFTDCSVLAEEYNLGCLNLSVGYKNEHTRFETCDFALMQGTLDKLLTVALPEQLFPAKTKYAYSAYRWQSGFKRTKPDNRIYCDYCGKHKPLYSVSASFALCKTCLDTFKADLRKS